MGAVAAGLLAELLTGAIAISWIAQSASGAWLRWSVPFRMMLCAGAAILLSRGLPFFGSLASGVMCGLAFLALAFATGGISVTRIRDFVTEIHGLRANPVPMTEGKS
jgi:hypothetical protein